MGGIAVARKLRYGVYDTEQRVWLARAELPAGDDGAMVTEWTKRAEKALRFPGIKSADAMLEKLGRFSEFVIVNGKGEIVG